MCDNWEYFGWDGAALVGRVGETIEENRLNVVVVSTYQ
jgi:hypothetical protein